MLYFYCRNVTATRTGGTGGLGFSECTDARAHQHSLIVPFLVVFVLLPGRCRRSRSSFHATVRRSDSYTACRVFFRLTHCLLGSAWHWSPGGLLIQVGCSLVTVDPDSFHHQLSSHGCRVCGIERYLPQGWWKLANPGYSIHVSSTM